MSPGLWTEFRWKGSLGVLPPHPPPHQTTPRLPQQGPGRECEGQREGDTRSGLSCSLSLGGQPRRPRRGRESVCKQGSCQEGAGVRAGGGVKEGAPSGDWQPRLGLCLPCYTQAHRRAGSRPEAHTRVQWPHTARCSPLYPHTWPHNSLSTQGLAGAQTRNSCRPRGVRHTQPSRLSVTHTHTIICTHTRAQVGAHGHTNTHKFQVGN